MELLNVTTSTCPQCRALVPAKTVAVGPDVWLRKLCPTHGESQARVSSDAGAYLESLRCVKPAWVPRQARGDAGAPCPAGCGLCARHEQHVCMPIVEITGRCDLACPVCLRSPGSRSGPDLAPGELAALLDRLIASEGQIDLLNFSGGEPLLHSGLLELIDLALARPEVVRVSLSTNGLTLLARPGLVDELKRRDVVVSLQYDGQDDGVYRALRGRALSQEKRAILELLAERDVTTSLTMTVAGGVNEDQIPGVLETWLAHVNVVSLMVQPAAFTGRARHLRSTWRRLTIPDLAQRIEQAGVAGIRAQDLLPLPCSHPHCFSLAFYLVLDDGRLVSVGRLADDARMLGALSNRVVFGLDREEHQQLKQWIYELWSGPAGVVPEGPAVLRAVKNLLAAMTPASGGAGCFDARRVFASAERRVKSIFIHAFQDADTFDLARVRRCCQAYPQPDGRLVPPCVRNVLWAEADQ